MSGTTGSERPGATDERAEHGSAETVGVIDIMNHAPFVAPGLFGQEFQYEELQIMLRTTFRSLMTDKGTVRTLWGTEVPADGSAPVDPTLKIEDATARMDRAGYELVVLTATKMWSYRYHHKLIMDYPLDLVVEAAEKSGGRLLAAASYNPFRIEDSLDEIDQAARAGDISYVWFHPMTFGVSPNDRRCYPLYAKCNELDIAVGLQVGHSAEVLPSDHGRPMLVDDVAIDFPDLRINLSHTGWPWTGEWCSMLWRHPNVYGDISAYFPSSLDSQLVDFMDSAHGRTKVLFGTNGLSLTRCKTEFLDLPLRDDTKRNVLRDNARRFLALDTDRLRDGTSEGLMTDG